MRQLRSRFAKVLLALLFGASAVPSWACVRSCDSGPASLGCVRLCAHSKALLTDGGRLDAIGADTCAVVSVDAQPALDAAPFHLAAPAHALSLAPAPASAPVLPLLAAEPHTRGPPVPASYLSSQHPFANGPPTLL